MASTHKTHAFGKVCIDLTLGLRPVTPNQTYTHSSVSSRKRKSCPNAPNSARKRVCSENKEKRGWGYSTTLMLYDDPWKIKKVLSASDLGSLTRLLLAKDLVQELVLPVLDAEAQTDAESDEGTRIRVWDVDTESIHYLVFKRWPSSGSYVFIGDWNQEFVKRRGLKKGDEVGFHWDSYKNRFDFTVFQTRKAE